MGLLGALDEPVGLEATATPFGLLVCWPRIPIDIVFRTRPGVDRVRPRPARTRGTSAY